MFDSPAHDAKAGNTSPHFGPRAGGMFDSPKPGFTHAGLNSPGFGGSQQSAGNIDNVFADLMHDHDHIGGFDGTSEPKEKAAAVPDAMTKLAQEASASMSVPEKPDVEMQDVKDVPAVPQPQGPPPAEREKSLTIEDFINSEH